MAFASGVVDSVGFWLGSGFSDLMFLLRFLWLMFLSWTPSLNGPCLDYDESLGLSGWLLGLVLWATPTATVLTHINFNFNDNGDSSGIDSMTLNPVSLAWQPLVSLISARFCPPPFCALRIGLCRPFSCMFCHYGPSSWHPEFGCSMCSLPDLAVVWLLGVDDLSIYLLMISAMLDCVFLQAFASSKSTRNILYTSCELFICFSLFGYWLWLIGIG